ncbi:YSC84-related protein [Chromobacterium sphagni]|uniref:Twin-arginine translocation pathway signal protein n=1 Tax=Chromobacterium sphagni TaxID=1903179 RepID=A0A1S1WVQ3_9NEIS|nr:lipid-binding SYLF domain-containing protein [Chromobacterium sphagni]OHX11216.1 twin-arginine translocation pathway signal protein [Chromobacterium sphagni]OHX19196.1 twin-arginine translocation pathway signal protein [Chromobacterium sphagni]
MIHSLRSWQKAWLLAATLLALGFASNPARAESAQDLDEGAAQSLQMLYQKSPLAENLSKKATAILVFPKIIKAGLIFGGAYGEGVLLESGRPNGYYNSVTGSWGWQAGAESFGYAVFLMNHKALRYLKQSKGWEIGTGPSIVVVDAGEAKNLTTTTLRGDAYAFIFDQQGLMASLSIEGTKISRIKR